MPIRDFLSPQQRRPIPPNQGPILLGLILEAMRDPSEIVQNSSMGGQGFGGMWNDPMASPPMLKDPYGNPIEPYPNPSPEWGHPYAGRELFMAPRGRSPRDMYLNRGPARWDIVGYKDPI